jgi:ABC-2 type transport system permease protein
VNIFSFEFRKYLGSLWIWALSLIGLLVMFMAFYPMLAEDAAVLDLFLSYYPEELLKAFGMGGELSLATVAGFLAFTFAMVQLCLAIQSAYYGFHFLSVEERELTADFLYAKPVSRARVLGAKYLAAMGALLATNGAVWAGTFLSIAWFGGDAPYDSRAVIALLLSVPIFQLFFFSLGFLATALTKKLAGVLGPAVAIASVLYMLNALRRIVGGELLGLLSPYYHFDPNYILAHGEWDLALASMSVIFIAGANIAAWLLFSRRDLRTAV